MSERTPAVALLLAVLAAACGPLSGQSPQEGERQLPAGHPPMSTSSPVNSLPPVPEDSGTGENAVVWLAPDGWVAETPKNAMRRAQYRIPGGAGDGECVVFYFGPGQGGDPMANAVRWSQQFIQPDGRASEDVMKTEQIEVNGVPVLLIEVTGTYSGGMGTMDGPANRLEDHMLLGAVAAGGDANWFFKTTGPRDTLEAQREAFQSMVASIRRGD